MNTSMINIFLSAAGILLGGFIGYTFGAIQNNALRRHTRMQKMGKLNSGWAIMPGSMRRTAYLLVLLAGVQIGCPILFEGELVQWLVSAGVILGYGWTLLHQMRNHSLYRA